METVNIVFGVLMTVVKYALTYWFCAFMHEMAHIAVGKYYGVKAIRLQISLIVWGTVFIVDNKWRQMMSRPTSKLAMASAGWMAHLLMFIAALVMIVTYGSGTANGFVQRLAWVNAFLLVWLAIPTGDPDLDSDMSYAALREMRKAKNELTS